MKIKTLDNKTINWNLTGYQINSLNDRAARSELHLKARKLIHEIFSPAIILEEVSIPPKRGTTLYLDFYIPLYKLCIEVSGKQHFQYIPHFHGDKKEFIKSQQRDSMKKDWCNLNGITLIELNYDESIEEWRDKLA